MKVGVQIYLQKNQDILFEQLLNKDQGIHILKFFAEKSDEPK